VEFQGDILSLFDGDKFGETDDNPLGGAKWELYGDKLGVAMEILKLTCWGW
jgi:hypothetical protein